MEGIAARAGVGKQTIYRWWPSKGAVLFDAFLALSEDAEGVPALPDTGDLEADLKLVLRATVAELNDPRYDVPMRAMAAAIASDPALAAEYEQRLEAPMRAIKLARLANAPELAPGTDLELVADLLWSPLLARWQQRRDAHARVRRRPRRDRPRRPTRTRRAGVGRRPGSGRRVGCARGRGARRRSRR